MRWHEVVGRLTGEFEGIGGVRSTGYSQAGGDLHAARGLFGDVGEGGKDQWRGDRERMSATEGRDGDCGSGVHAFVVEDCGIWCAGGGTSAS